MMILLHVNLQILVLYFPNFTFFLSIVDFCIYISPFFLVGKVHTGTSTIEKKKRKKHAAISFDEDDVVNIKVPSTVEDFCNTCVRSKFIKKVKNDDG